MGGHRGIGQGAGDEGPQPGPAGRQLLVLELAVGLEHGVRVDGDLVDHRLDGGELVTLEQAEAQGLTDLVDDLPVGRHAGRLSMRNSITVSPFI